MARVPANSYGDGAVYVGGNLIKQADGTIIRVKGYFTSPSGKRTYTDDSGNILVLKAADIHEVGTTYANGEIKYKPSEIMTEFEIVEEAKKIANGAPVEDFLISAAVKLGGANKA